MDGAIAALNASPHRVQNSWK